MKSNSVSGLGSRHDALIAGGALEHTYHVAVTLRLSALDPEEAEDMVTIMIDAYNGFRRTLPGPTAHAGPAVIVQQLVVEDMSEMPDRNSEEEVSHESAAD